MASWHGWDLGEMRMAGSEMDQIGELYEQSARPTSTAFTPVNPMQAPLQFISPQRTLYERDIFDVVGGSEEVAEVPISIPKKRSRAQAEGRAISLDPLWEYVDEGDLASHNNGDDFETTLPKRRKPTSVKRSKSTKSESNILPSFRPDDSTQSPEMDVSEQHGSQLSTPPDSGNGKKKRTPSVKARVSKSKMGPFKAPTITKPAVVKQKEIVEEPVQSKPITYLGHTTTQQIVMLSQTTLDRLATFRYTPSTTPQSSEPSKDVYRNTQLQIRPDVGVYVEPSGAPLDGDGEESYVHEDGDFHEPASQEQYSQAVEEDAIRALHENYATSNDSMLEATPSAHATQLRAMGPVEHNHGLKAIPAAEPNSVLFDPGSPLQLEAKDQALSTTKQSCEATQQNEPASETEPNGIVAQVQSTRSSPPRDTGFSETIRTADMLDSVLDCAEQVLKSSSLPHDQTAKDCEKLLGSIGTEDSDIQPEQASSQVLPAWNPANNRSHITSNHVQIERSDIDEVATENGDMSTDYDFHEFDEGLNDSDLVELVSEQIVPATQSDPVEDFPMKRGSDQSQQHPNGEYHNPRHDQASAPEVLNLNTDDGFSLEDDIEEEMVHLDFEVIERFQPPSSVQVTSDGCSTLGEVFDKGLQFSSPIRNSVSPNQQTNIDSALQSQSAVPELSMDDTEDWSFISSQSRSLSSKNLSACANPAVASLTGHEEVMEISPTKRTVVLGSSRQRQDSPGRQTTASIRTSLDDSHDYEPLRPFARPDFPTLIRDRSPVVGLSPQIFLRVCFRVAEMLKEGARCNALQENAIVELFAKVTHSSRESGTTRQNFQFGDLWHERPPFPSGILANYKSPDLLRTESKVFIGTGEAKMARCFGRLKRDSQSSTGWLLDIISIRTTDWEEIKWTKRIVSAGLLKSEK